LDSNPQRGNWTQLFDGNPEGVKSTAMTTLFFNGNPQGGKSLAATHKESSLLVQPENATTTMNTDLQAEGVSRRYEFNFL
jgi:hypothetical protein